MAQNLLMRKEFRNSSKKTRRSTSVFYLNSTTSDKTLLIEAEKCNDNNISELFKSNLTTTLTNQDSSQSLRKSQSSDDASISKSSSTSVDLTSTSSSADTVSKSSNSTSSSFQYNYSVNSTIVGDLDSNNLPNLNITTDKKPKVPERKRIKTNLMKSKVINQNLENVIDKSATDKTGGDINKVDVSEKILNDENADEIDMPHSNYWSNEIHVGVTKTNYVQKLRLKFEMFSSEISTGILLTPDVEVTPKNPGNNGNNTSFLQKITTPRRKTCQSGFNLPSSWSYLGNNNNNKNNKNVYKSDNNRHCDDQSKLLSDYLHSEDEVDEISDCEELVEPGKTESKQHNIFDNNNNNTSNNNKKNSSKKKLKSNKSTKKESIIPTIQVPSLQLQQKSNTDDVPKIIIDDFGKIALDDNGKSQDLKLNKCDDVKSKIDKTEKPEIKKRKGIMRSIHRRRTDVCEAKNIKCILSKSHSYHPEELLSDDLSDRDVKPDQSTTDGTSSKLGQLETHQDDFKYGSTGILPMVEELIKTEEKYVESLREGIKNYGEIFTRDDIPEGLKGKRYDLLGNIEEILEFHETFFLPILKINSNDLVAMFNSFTNLIEENEFYPYIIFVINKRNSIRLLDKYQCYFKKLQKEIEDRLGINSFLIKPIQRLQRYPLPLQEFYKTQFGDISYKAAIAACCKLEKRLRDFITVVNESEAINDIEDCFDLNIYHQGRFFKADDFKIYDYSIRKLYPAKGFFFEKCIIYTEVKEKRLLYRGHYPMQKLGFLPNSKSTKFTLYYDKRKKQECDFEAEPCVIDIWTKLIQPILEAVLNEEMKKNEARHSAGQTHNSSIGSGSVIFRQFNCEDFQNAYRISNDSGIESMTPCQNVRPTSDNSNEEGRMSTWYDTM